MKKHVILACLVLLGMCVTASAQIAPQIQGAGAPANPCANGGQQYVDQTNHVLYGCPNSGGNWVNLGLGNLTGGGGGSVTHTAGNLTAFHLMLGNGLADSTVDSACVTNGTGALSGCTSLSAGSGASAAGATATGGFACVEAASTGWTPTVGQDYQRCDSTAHAFVCSNNGAAEAACSPAPAYPQTVSGMTSGGVLYGSSATQVSSSAALAAGALVVGGGAGAAPTTGNADCTFLVHTLACGAAGLVNFGALPAAGLIIPKIAAGGTGSTSGAIQYSTDFDGYVFGANGQRDSIAIAALGGNATTNCGSTNQVFTLISAQTAPVCSSLSAFVTSDYTNATTTLSNVTGLAVTLVANINYAVSCKLIYQGSAVTASMILSSTGPASPTKISAQNTQTTTSGAGAAMYSDASDGTSFAFTLGPTAIVTTAADLPSTLDIGIMNGANAGTFQLQAKSNGAGTITIKKGSFCKWQ